MIGFIIKLVIKGFIYAGLLYALSKYLNIPDHLKISLVIALGKPKEKVVIDELKNNDVKYWRDENGVHHVPKRNLDDLIIE